MFLRSLRLFAATLLAVLLAVACGGDSAPPPTVVTAVPGDTTVTLTWAMKDGEEYWLFFGQTSTPPGTSSMHDWIGLPGGSVLLKVTSPYLVTGLYNGDPYSFSVNARISGGPGGPGSTAVIVTPRPAGGNWVAGNPVGSANLKGVAYGSQTTTITNTAGVSTPTIVSTYIAAGDGGAIYSSNDGVSWTPVAYATSTNLNGASFYSSGLATYKVVGDGGLVLVSSDGATWGAQTTPTTQNLYGIATNSVGLFVAVGANGTIIYNADGVNWIAATSSGTTSDLYAVTNDSYLGIWVAVGAGGTIVESTDGKTWHSVTSPSTVALHGVASNGINTLIAGNPGFVAVGAAGTVVGRSADGTWGAQTLPGVGTLNGIVNGASIGGQYVAVGAGGAIFFSQYGTSWTAASSTSTKNLYAVAHGLYDYSAVGEAGTNLLSK